jgi:glucose-6-phosphate-specific signal transduction histidine kinase
MDWMKKHVDTVIVLGGILGAILWMNGKFNDIDKRFNGLEREVTIIKTVLLMKDIYPKELLLNNWAEAIQSMAFRFQTNSCKIVCDFNPIPNFKNEIQIQSYRSIQEILTNIVKHNNPHSITVQCYSEKNKIHVYFVYQFKKANALNLPSLGRGTAVLNNRLKFIKGELDIPQKINEQESFFTYETELKFTYK